MEIDTKIQILQWSVITVLKLCAWRATVIAAGEYKKFVQGADRYVMMYVGTPLVFVYYFACLSIVL